jgi:NAD(P)-dependent dehydrogenase (short-subunit alcohol dehydrogenase family)
MLRLLGITDEIIEEAGLVQNPILVTGAAGGIGRALTHKLLSNGFSVVAVDLSADGPEDLTGAAGLAYLQSDLNDLDAIPELVRRIVSQYGPLRGLVHCAGFDRLAPLYLSRSSDLLGLLRIHAMAPIALCSQIAKKGNAAPGCAIVLISSLAAHEGAAGHSAYAAAKGALEGFLPSAAAELADRGIRVNVVIPGVVKTRMSAGFIDKMTEEQKEALERSYPLGLGEPEDVASAISFLLSDEARWITGQTLIVDGGHMCRRV